MCQSVNVKLEANARVYISLGSIVQWNLHSRPPLHSTASFLADSPYTMTSLQRPLQLLMNYQSDKTDTSTLTALTQE